VPPLGELIDVVAVQALMDDFYAFSDMPIALIDLEGRVLVGTGWQDVCTKFHRVNPETLANCRESDLVLTQGVARGAFRAYTCKNGLSDTVTPLFVGETHVGNVFTGQFFYDGEEPDIAFFEKQAERYGFDRDGYLDAIRRVPRVSHASIDALMRFYIRLAEQIARTGYANLELTKVVEERRLAAEALAESELRYRRLFENSPLGYQSLDGDGRLIIVNSAWLDLLGYSEDEVVGTWFGDFLAPAYREAFRERFPLFKEAGRIHSEFEMVCKDGSAKFVGFDGVIGHDLRGEFLQTHCVLKDITEERSAALALAESEDKFKYFFDHSVLGMSITSPTGEVHVNSAFAAMLGYSVGELEQRDIQELTHPDDFELTAREMSSLISGESDSTHFEKRYLRKDGSIVWALVSSTLRRDAQGAPLYFMNAVLDITERKTAEEALWKSETGLRAAQAVSHVGSWVWHVKSNRLDWSDEMYRIFGIDKGDFSGDLTKVVTTAIHPDDREAVEQSNRAVMLEGRLAPLEYRIVRSDGTERVVWAEAGGIELDVDGSPVRLTGIVADITERKQAAAALFESNIRLEGVLKSITAAMGKVVETRDPYTQGHEQGVAALGRQIAREMGLPEEGVEEIELAALVHDIGKLAVPAEILTKPGKLSDLEFELIKQHSQSGYSILRDIDFGWPIADIVLQHHERMDGSGYPNGLLGEDISMAARIIAVADVIEAMASHRPYRPSLGLDIAMAEIVDHPDKFDADVSAACVRLFQAGRIEL